MKLFRKFFAAAVIALTAGCVNIDYVGQKLSPLPEDQLVTFFSEKQSYPENEFALLGRAKVSAPDGTDILSIKEDLQDEARKIGADAVKIVSFNRVKVGTIQVSGSGSEPDAVAFGYTSRTVGGDQIYTDSFGRTSAQPSKVEDKYEVIMQVQFLANRTKFDAAMMERAAERAAAIQAEVEAEEAALEDIVISSAEAETPDETVSETEIEEVTPDEVIQEQIEEVTTAPEDDATDTVPEESTAQQEN
ncbi:MAG: hypothetical protein ACI4OV_06890 [Victivallaceae bacterium]